MRDPRSLALALLMPVLLLVLFSYALSLDVDQVPTLIYDQDETPESRSLIAQFEGSRYFSIEGYAANYQDIDKAIDENRVMLAVVIPHDFARFHKPVQLLL